jgi:phosphate transport system substrate-binding protein
VGVRPTPRVVLLLMLLVLTVFAAVGCGRDKGNDEPAAGGDNTTESTEQLSGGAIEIDGSSTVGPLVTVAAESFQAEQPDVRVTVGISGTGGGFERFCAGETDISNASRPIKEDEEVPLCQESGIEYTELRVATDALTVVVNPENDWVECMTVEQLAKAWGPDSEGKVKSWSDVDPSFPDEPLTLAGAGTDSGTFDYFTDAINGEEGASRSDYTASEDDNVTVRAVESEKGAMGYFGFSYYEQNQDSLKALEIDGGGGCVAPSVETAQADEYAPLSRPLFIYVKNESLTRPEVKAFVQYLLDNAQTVAEEALFIPLNDDQLAESTSTFEQATG